MSVISKLKIRRDGKDSFYFINKDNMEVAIYKAAKGLLRNYARYLEEGKRKIKLSNKYRITLSEKSDSIEIAMEDVGRGYIGSKPVTQELFYFKKVEVAKNYSICSLAENEGNYLSATFYYTGLIISLLNKIDFEPDQIIIDSVKDELEVTICYN